MAAFAWFEAIPERGSLKAIAGQVETVIKIDRTGRVTSSHRYDLELKQRDGKTVTVKIDQDAIGSRDLAALYQKPVNLRTTPDNWVMAINSGGKDVLSYDTARRVWEDDIRSRLQFGLGFVLFGLVLGAFHVWKARRGRAPSGA